MVGMRQLLEAEEKQSITFYSQTKLIRVLLLQLKVNILWPDDQRKN